MKPSVLRNLMLSFLALGLVMGAVFPVFANLFVEWKPGMLVWFVVSALAAGAIVGLANYWLVNWVLLSKLRRISQVATAISKKDISHTCSMESHDMIGEIIQGFNKMAENLRELIGEVANMSGHVNRDANTIQGLMAGVRSRFDAQQHTVASINSSTETLSETVAEISSSARQVSEAARNASNLAKSGGNIVQETIQGMRQINESVTLGSSAVDNLGRKSDEIGAIVAVINGIAEQTNLLALNAAIEAARAGEQGRGFAVVADEVRKLAEKTAQATQEISGMIQSVQQETRNAISTMQSGTEQVRGGVEKATEAGRALQEIVLSVERVSEMIERIAAGASSQNQMVSEVRNHVDEISQMVQDASVDTMTGEQATSALASLSAELDQVIKQFKLS
ncbi:MAG: methyl-accepting chemotaxis protein [Gammaproteobacteria bacterium]|nr:methyl-accepting chemotaxis protein [Gammaproteobacteria bacterium]MBU1731097.1 methyl-accepting chemotaxis protein [Gammaproteobacteria bacterium]MBU1894161.1 methyl-accepting chemotaxis protein [Gammaproteobacteria bacterium]